jgi:hypothetical protein
MYTADSKRGAAQPGQRLPCTGADQHSLVLRARHAMALRPSTINTQVVGSGTGANAPETFAPVKARTVPRSVKPASLALSLALKPYMEANKFKPGSVNARPVNVSKELCSPLIIRKPPAPSWWAKVNKGIWRCTSTPLASINDA